MSEALVTELRAALGPHAVRDADSALAIDRWCHSAWRRWRGEPIAEPMAIVRPRSAEEVQALVRFVGERGIAIMPRGLGSGVCGGVLAAPEVVVLDMSGMNRVRGIDETNLLAAFDAGMNGQAAEEAVAARGLTIGHHPQSIAISSVGGWVSTRASGQFSTAYGNIEDIVYAIEAVLPNGDLVTLGKAPRAAAGPDLRHLLMGAEGTMGVITGVTLSLRRAPEERALLAFHVPGLETGLEAQRAIVQSGWLPPVMRQYDPRESRRLFGDYAKDGEGLLLLVSEGPAVLVTVETQAVRAIAKQAGLAEADPAAVSHWLERRNHTPEWTQLFEMGLIADTIEVSARWTDIAAVYHRAVEALGGVPGIINASAHSSHAYRSGVNLYFSFAVRPDEPGAMGGAYFDAWGRVMEATAVAGGGVAHHHGVGRLRKPWLHHDLGGPGLGLLRTIKDAVDPRGIMNPGNLIPDA